MSRPLVRLFVDAPLSGGASIALGDEQANYLLRVLRLVSGDEIAVFNGCDGEHAALIAEAGKRRCTLTVGRQLRAQEAGPDIDYLFAPLKRSRLDYMVQKATELGVRRLRPVTTERTQVERINQDRMRANAVEAAEQCGVLWVPEVLPPSSLEEVLTGWDAARRLIFADEAMEHAAMKWEPVHRESMRPSQNPASANPIATLSSLPRGPLAVLVGPEGGFSEAERRTLRALPSVTPISLGPRIMRADTAAVAVLALVMAVLGDWG